MRHADLSHVLDGSYELLGIGAADFRAEGSLLGEEIKEFSSFCEFKDDDCSFFLGFVADLDLGLKSAIDDVDEVWEVEF